LHGAVPRESHSFAVRTLPLDRIDRFWKVAYGRHWEEIPDTWFAIADAQDGNFIVMDLASVDGDRVKIIDGFAEAARVEAPIIARSFTEFLERSIDDPDTSSGAESDDGKRYWSKGNRTQYGDARA
jgi:hypothetical protein